MTDTPDRDQSTRNGILIVGDWVVDEYWFLVRHRSVISSHTGFTHYRIASSPEEVVSDLCGAGHVARVLYQLRDRENPYRLWGVGAWNQDDSELIQHLIHAREKDDCKAAAASFQLQTSWCDDPPDIHLSSVRADSSTTRVVRLYHQEKGSWEQINRIDWEPQREPEAKGKKFIWGKAVLPAPEELRMIVINDLGKGVVTTGRIKDLLKRYPDAGWCVRSKIREPEWLKAIGSSLELLVIGPEIAALMNPWDRWLAGARITLQGLEVIATLPGKHVVLLSNQPEVLARLNQAQACVTARSLSELTILTQLGWPTAFFASLARRVYEKPIDVTEEDVDITKEDIAEAHKRAAELSGVPLPGDEDNKNVVLPQTNETTWKEEEDAWNQATAGCGVIKDNNELRFDVWRGSTLLPEYIACIKAKQKAISQVSQHLIGFKRAGTQSRPVCIMLQADPGAGKTFLAKALARSFNFSFLRFDVTQMLHRDELLDLFDLVATRQADDRDILVFVDEINARLDASHVYGAFLAPLEEGFYMRRGNMFSIKPCVWIFAGTNRENAPDNEADKFEDFSSRMTLIEKIDYGSLRGEYTNPMELEREARLEQVYLGATMIRKLYPDVTKVSKEVLLNFWDMDPAVAPARKIRRYVTSLSNVQYGQVTKENCEHWDQAIWNREGGEKIVKLTFT